MGEALCLAEHQEQDRDQAFQELKTKLDQGATQAERGELLDGGGCERGEIIGAPPSQRSQQMKPMFVLNTGHGQD